jgi:hypothetical protein
MKRTYRNEEEWKRLVAEQQASDEHGIDRSTFTKHVHRHGGVVRRGHTNRKHDYASLMADYAKHGEGRVPVTRWAKERGLNSSAFHYQWEKYKQRRILKGLVRDEKKETRFVGPFVASTEAIEAHGAQSLNGHIRVTLKSGAIVEVSNGNDEGLKTILRATGDLA